VLGKEWDAFAAREYGGNTFNPGENMQYCEYQVASGQMAFRYGSPTQVGKHSACASHLVSSNHCVFLKGMPWA